MLRIASMDNVIEKARTSGSSKQNGINCLKGSVLDSSRGVFTLI